MRKRKSLMCLLIAVIACLFIPILNPVNAEEKEPITVYLFHSTTCPHCQQAMAFFKKLLGTEEYKGMFQVRAIETSKYSEISDEASQIMRGKDISGVPYIVIGEQEFEGYSSSSDEKIKNAIKEAYENNVEDKIKSVVGEAGELLTGEESSGLTGVIVLVVALVIIGGTIYFARSGSEEEKEETKKEIKEEPKKVETAEEKKEEVKEETTSTPKKKTNTKKKANSKKKPAKK